MNYPPQPVTMHSISAALRPGFSSAKKNFEECLRRTLADYNFGIWRPSAARPYPRAFWTTTVERPGRRRRL